MNDGAQLGSNNIQL